MIIMHKLPVSYVISTAQKWGHSSQSKAVVSCEDNSRGGSSSLMNGSLKKTCTEECQAFNSCRSCLLTDYFDPPKA